VTPGLVRCLARRALVGAAVALVAASAVFYVMAHFADRLIFLPPPPTYGRDLDGLVLLPTSAGDTVAGRMVEAPAASLAVLHTHGNAEDIGLLDDFVAPYTRLGVTVLAVEYPGYGLSSGEPSEPGAYAGADAALAYLATRGYAADRVVLHGRSLGGAVAVDLAARHAVAGVILESTFTSAFHLMLPFDGLPGDRFTSLEKIPRVHSPALVIHGTQDEVVPFGHGERLFAALPPERRKAWWVEGAGHNDLLWRTGERYWDEIGAFLATLQEPGP